MGESANLAFYAIVYAKGLVPRERLQDAMHRATLEGLAMEQVLLQWGLLTQPQVDELALMRRRLARTCTGCKKLTYLLQDQSEQSTPCEHCGGALQPPRQSARMRRPGQSSARTAPPDLDARLARAEERILAKALESVETRMAQEDLTGFLKAVVKKASQAAVDAVAAQVQELQEAAAGASPAAPSADLVAQVVAQVQSQLPPPPSSADLVAQVVTQVQSQLPPPPSNDAMHERATQSAVEAIQEYDLGSLPERVAQQVLERLEAEGPNDALVEQVASAVQARQGEAPELTEAPELSQAHLDALFARVEEVLDAKIAAPDGLAEHMAQHVLDKIPGLTSDSGSVDASVSEADLAKVSAQATEAALSQVEQRIESALAQVDQRVAEQIERSLAGLRGQLAQDVIPQVVQAVEQRLGVGLEQVLGAAAEQAVQQVELRSPKPQPTITQPAGEVGGDALREIMDTVETRFSEFDMAFDAVIMEATDKAVETMEARLAARGPSEAGVPGPPADVVEVTREATAQVMRVVEARLADLPQGGGDIDEGRLAQRTAEQVLGVVEARLAGLEGGGGGGAALPADVDVEAIAARVSADVMGQVEERLRALPMGSVGTETSSSKTNTGVYDRKFIALAREVKNLKDSVGKGGGGGGDSTRQGAALVNSEEFRALLESRVNQAISAAGGGVPGSKKGGELVGMLNTPEFKQVFDQKINQVLAYVKSDLVPSAVKKALREVESS